jgi:hypothetical protein
VKENFFLLVRKVGCGAGIASCIAPAKIPSDANTANFDKLELPRITFSFVLLRLNVPSVLHVLFQGAHFPLPFR